MKEQVTNIQAYVTYSFPLGLLTQADIANIDDMHSRLCKRVHGLLLSPASAMVFEDKSKAGVGLTSTCPDDHQELSTGPQ